MVSRFLLGEEGPTAVEYAVLLALITVACVAVLSSLGMNSRETFEQIRDSVRAR